MDSLGAKTFAATATSSGGLHALTLAAKYPDRVTALQMICCDASYAPGFPIAESGEFNSAEGADGLVKYVDGGTRPGCVHCASFLGHCSHLALHVSQVLHVHVLLLQPAVLLLCVLSQW